MVEISGPLPDMETLRQHFSYDPISGVIVWKLQATKPRNWNTKYAGKEAGCSNGRYRQIRLDGRTFLYHRAAWALHHGTHPGESSIDHINGDTFDNRACNIRLASTSDNGRNSRRREGCVLLRGVKRHHRGKLYEAQIRTRPGERISLGTFPSAAEAHAAYCRAALKYHGEFARFD